MGIFNSKNSVNKSDSFFERQIRKEQKLKENTEKKLQPANRRVATNKVPSLAASPVVASPLPLNNRSFEDDALDLLRDQLNNDANAFLLDNILLSVQFFDNYERQVEHIKKNPISAREHMINEAMVRHNKHVFFADRLQECVNEHVGYQKTHESPVETLTNPRLFVIYDNMEASDPGDFSDYSAVLDAPFYKLRIEDCENPGYLVLRKLEVLESTLLKDNDSTEAQNVESDDNIDTIKGIDTDSDKENTDSDDEFNSSQGESFLDNLKNKLSVPEQQNKVRSNVNVNMEEVENFGRRFSGPTKSFNMQVMRSNISKMKDINKSNGILVEEDEHVEEFNDETDIRKKKKMDTIDINIERPRKSILKNARQLSGPIKNFKRYPVDTTTVLAPIEDNEILDSKNNHNQINNIDYAYATIKEATTPKKIELSSLSHNSTSSGVLPDEIWKVFQIQTLDDDDDDEENMKKLYDTHYYLSSIGFMKHFVDDFFKKLGNALDLSHKAIKNSMTQGASVYCNAIRDGKNSEVEISPALIAAWPRAANAWLTRERKIIMNPWTNFCYQWPNKNMVNKAETFGCLLVPVGYRPKRGTNDKQEIQWKIVFPAAERYLENCLAHAPMRCYLFALLLHKTFLINEDSKLGIDASHIKNHLFWQCEDNYAKWPEHRLGEVLRLFLRTFYSRMAQSRFPNYFMVSCNDFEYIPQPLLSKQQYALAKMYEALVMHLLYALDKIKYTSKEFYPKFDANRLYNILTTKNLLRIIYPNAPVPDSNSNTRSVERKNNKDYSTKKDTNYIWKRQKQRQIQERRKAISNNKKVSNTTPVIKKDIILPNQLEGERRRLVLEFFISHFIAMARSSENFDANRQAVIYLKQAQRLCRILKEGNVNEATVKDYFDVIRDKLEDCHRKIATQESYIKSPRRVSNVVRTNRLPRTLPRYEHISAQDSPTDLPGISPFTFVDVHVEHLSQDVIKLNDFDMDEEDSKL